MGLERILSEVSQAQEDKSQPGMAAHAFNPSTREAQAGESL